MQNSCFYSALNLCHVTSKLRDKLHQALPSVTRLSCTVWDFHLVYCFRIDMSAVQGQSSRLSVILRGTQSSRLVRCFSSHPEELQASSNTECYNKII